MIQQTTALRKISGLKKRIKVIRGGQGAGKTISILILLINHASSKANKEILIVSEELTKMRLTVIKDFVKVMQLAGIYQESHFLAGTLYRFKNGSFIKFIGLDKEDIGKGLRCDIAYFNEVNKIDFESYRQVASRANKIFCDYNPDAEFFIDKEVIGRDDCDFLQLTYDDNELLDDNERKEILSYKDKGYNPDGTILNEYWANLWNVYGLGNIGSLRGVVFSNWTDIDQLPQEAKLLGYGADWGFTNDPTTLIGIYQWNGQYIFDEIIYQKGLVNSEIANLFKSKDVTKSHYIYADSAEPKTIQDIANYGFRIKGAEKGKDSVMFGISLMQEQKFLVTKQSTNLIKELRSYVWDTDKSGKQVNKPIDAFNHCIDAIRYYFTSLNKNYGKYDIR
jgi:phage terminase large subunit